MLLHLRATAFLRPLSRVALGSLAVSLFWFLAVLGSGCARFDPQPISPAESADRLEHRSFVDSGLREFLNENLSEEVTSLSDPEWDFDMLTLASFYFHPNLQLAQAHWQVLKAGEVTAGQRPNPNLTVTPGYNTTTAVPSPWLPSVTLDVPLETAGKRRFRQNQAAYLSEAGRLNVVAAGWNLRGNVRASVADLQSAASRERVLHDQFALQTEALRLMEGQVQAGALAGAELLPWRLAQQKTRLELADAQRLQAEARSRLAEALGVPIKALSEAKLAFDWSASLPDRVRAVITENDGPGMDLRRMRQQALTGRADLLALLAEYAAAQSALQLEIARQYPDVRFSPGYQYDQGENKWTLGLSVEVPLLHQNQGPIAEARAHREEAAARFNAAQAKVLAEIDRAVDLIRLSQAAAASAHAMAENQLQQRDTIAARVQAGAAIRSDLLSAEVEALAGKLAELDAETKLLQAAGAFEDAVQRPIFGKLEPASVVAPGANKKATK